ncbi:MAG TPA: non-canonical purine NTP pyrophosphatase, partial [Myxococcota bacterium]|nr:non-canonical purine NTP pyrophosphatase [Myxococcota bacterium]
GTHGDDRANLEKLLRELARAENRRARFVCTVAVSEPDGEVTATARGTCEGAIALTPRGAGGFGYDPIFLPDGAHGRTMAELTSDEKGRLSHRGQALRRIAPFLREVL